MVQHVPSCRDNADCPEQASECVSGRCEICELGSNRGCESDTPICVVNADGNLCVGCRGDDDCIGPERGQCVDTTCLPCDVSDNAGCGGETPFCAVDGESTRCVGCRGNGDCSEPTTECVAEVCRCVTRLTTVGVVVLRHCVSMPTGLTNVWRVWSMEIAAVPTDSV